MFCNHCGNELMNEAVVCPKCGCAVNNLKNINGYNKDEDIPSGGLNVLSFFIPLVGLILFCVMYSETPRKAKSIGLFALVGFVINFVLLMFMWM